MAETSVTSREGSLESAQFAQLLASIAQAQETAVLLIQHRQLCKQVVFHEGVPVDCKSNLAHETLGRFMASKGLIEVAAANRFLAEAMTREMDLGELLVEKGACTAEELPKIHQQNLAKKLLDGFSWRDGQYLISSEVPEVSSPLSINVGQLIFMGVMRFADQQQVDASIATLIGQPLKLHPGSFFSVEDIRLARSQRQLLELFDREHPRIDELAAQSELSNEELTRFLHALMTLGLVGGGEARVQLAPPLTAREELERLLLRDPRDPVELIGLPEGTDPEALADGFLRVAKLCAPWQADEDLADRSREMFLRSARAFVELSKPAASGHGIVADELESKPTTEPVTPRTEPPRTEPPRTAPAPRTERVAAPAPSTSPGMLRQLLPAAAADAFRIETNLLDPALQHAKGKSLMKAKSYAQAITQLEFAYDLDPQNSEYRADLAYCRHLLAPATSGSETLAELEETLRIDPDCGLAWYYSGEIHSRAGRFDQAEQMLRKAIKPMAPDRRPIDALHDMKRRGKGRK